MSRSVRRSARVVVLGAGFAGASLLRHLPPMLRRSGETLLIDRREEYTFVPLIHEVAVGRVHPRTVSSPIAPLCAGAAAAGLLPLLLEPGRCAAPAHRTWRCLAPGHEPRSPAATGHLDSGHRRRWCDGRGGRRRGGRPLRLSR